MPGRPAVDILKVTHQVGSTGMVWMPIGCAIWGAYWRYLANMTEPSVCNGDVALRQITFTTCLHMSSSTSFCYCYSSFLPSTDPNQ